MNKITVFTPTYNRAYTLQRLYDSLNQQTNKSFVWLIVDDGSTDNTRELVEGFVRENKIDIHYCYQENAGKSQAQNHALELTDSEIFVGVDSDDYLTSDAIEKILYHWEQAKTQNGCIGLLACKCAEKVENSLTKVNYKKLQKGRLTTVREAYSSGAIKGDAMMIYKTSEIKKFPFPRFDGEKFVPEAYLYDKLDQIGELYFTDERLYIAEYLSDGYTAGMEALNFKNANGYFAYISQRLPLDTRIKNIIIDVACYISICFVLDKPVIYPQKKLLSLILFPLGYALYFKRYRRFKIKKP